MSLNNRSKTEVPQYTVLGEYTVLDEQKNEALNKAIESNDAGQQIKILSAALLESQKRYVEQSKRVEAILSDMNRRLQDYDDRLEAITKAIGDSNRQVDINISTHLQNFSDRALSESMKPFKNQIYALTEEFERRTKQVKNQRLSVDSRLADVLWSVKTFIILLIAFSVPVYLYAQYDASKGISAKILWNQNYPNQMVTPFTEQEQFEKQMENQDKYLEQQKLQQVKSQLKQK